MEIRSLGYRTDLLVRALEGSQIEDRGDYLVIRSPHNPDFWWGNFLLLREPPAPGQADQWLARFAAEFPQASHVTLGVDVAEADVMDSRELTAAGFSLTTSVVLTTSDVRPPSRPSIEASYRPLSGDDDWRQATELRAVLYEDGAGTGSAFLRSRTAAQRAMTETGHGCWHGAFINGELLSQLGIITGPGGLARYQDVETHPAARRQGLASTLLWHAAQAISPGSDERTLVIVADPQDAAIRLYQSAGFTTVQTQIGFDRPPSA
jgi:ribosomal protein S18 acetylase RimI-like enzyme